MNYILCVSFAMAVICPVSARRNICNEGNYFDRHQRDCVPCSECQENQLILRVCHGHVDTKCGKFADFDFQQAANSKVMDDTRNQPQNRALETGTSDNIEKTVKPDQVAEDDSWYSITIILVGVLVAGIIAVAVLATIACVMYRKKRDYDPAASSTLIQPMESIDKMDNFKVVYET
ncbi:hypothetical protein CHS0354_018306 [Potamilus streckersoni]|uniref:TNFR-Cys domain-containing protein n=1 Tax=Potamilus streckersoni TaxID=2493646 RepID=A0AAE0TKF6_9BIVA|nr:hypothetical protein CHS0354_018306 [Potamilus streckersoni]